MALELPAELAQPTLQLPSLHSCIVHIYVYYATGRRGGKLEGEDLAADAEVLRLSASRREPESRSGPSAVLTDLSGSEAESQSASDTLTDKARRFATSGGTRRGLLS